MASASGPYAAVDHGLACTDETTRQLVTGNLQRLLSRNTMDVFMASGMHQDLLLSLEHCLASLCYVNEALKDESYPVQWVFDRQREMQSAIEALETSMSKEAWRLKICAKDMFFQICNMLVLLASRRIVAQTIVERMKELLSLPLVYDYSHALNMSIVQSLVKHDFVLLCAAHVEGLRNLAQMLVFCVRVSLQSVIDYEGARHHLFSFLQGLKRLQIWIQAYKDDQMRGVPMMPMDVFNQ